jgi:hypothetical protein
MFNFFKENKTEEQDHWESFRGKGNSNEGLAEKAKILAAVIVDWTRAGTLQLIEYLEKDAEDQKPKDKFVEIFLESVILYVHFADRIASQLLKTNQRDFFMNALINEVTNIFSESQPTEEQKELATSIIGDLYNERQSEYGNYKMAAEENEGLGSTLFWEFGKKIANIVGFERDTITVFQAQVCIVGGLKFLQLSKLFEE